MRTNREIIEEIVRNWDDAEYICAWNEYCDKNNYDENRIWDMDEIDTIYSHLSPSELLNAIASDFDINDCYFQDGCYGITSGCDPQDMSYPEDLIDAIADEPFEYSDYLTDYDFREGVEDDLGEGYADFEAWFEEKYGDAMYEHNIKELYKEYKSR